MFNLIILDESGNMSNLRKIFSMKDRTNNIGNFKRYETDIGRRDKRPQKK